MDRQKSFANNAAAEIEEEYQEFLDKLSLLKKEQEQLVKEYREKLTQRKLARLSSKINMKGQA